MDVIFCAGLWNLFMKEAVLRLLICYEKIKANVVLREISHTKNKTDGKTVIPCLTQKNPCCGNNLL